MADAKKQDNSPSAAPSMPALRLGMAPNDGWYERGTDPAVARFEFLL